MASTPVVKASRYGYAETVSRLTTGIAAAGNVLFATIDQAAAAERVGLTLRPTTLLVFGNPKGGTPLMAGYPLAAIALPLKLLVWEENGVTQIAHARMAEILADAGVPAGDPRAAAMDRALESLTDSVA